MQKVLRLWSFKYPEKMRVEQIATAVFPPIEQLANDEFYQDGDKEVTYNYIDFVSYYDVYDNGCPLLTREEFINLCARDQASYINVLGDFYADDEYVSYDPVSDCVVDAFSGVPIENAYIFLVGLNTNSTNLQNRCFND